MPKSRSLFLLTLGITLTGWLQICYGLKSDKEQPISVSANSAERNEKLGLTIYRGQVVIKQGTVLIEADEVILKTLISKKNSTEELQEIITTGQPTHFQQQIKVEGDLVDATANTILYRVAEKKVDLLDKATLKQQGRTITGDKISYDVSAEKVTANGHEPANNIAPGRVTIVIPPKPNVNNTNDSKP